MSTTPRVLPQVYLNGAILPIDQAHISVLDRGYLFGDALYEVIPVFAGRLFRPERHLERLKQGLQATGISSANSNADWLRILTRVIDANGGGDMAAYLQISRGVGSYRDHAVRTPMVPGVFAMAQTLTPRADDVGTRGVRAVLLEDTRWARCNIKATSLLANVLLRQQAVDNDAMEAILHRDGIVTEGAASSIMMVCEGRLIVVPESARILPGTTRSLIEELAATTGIPLEARRFSTAELLAADEVLLSAATKQLLPVCLVDQTPIGRGTPGAVWKQLDVAYKTYRQQWLTDSDAASQEADPPEPS